MIPFPDISPNLFAFEFFGREIALRWYALAYMAGLLYGWWHTPPPHPPPPPPRPPPPPAPLPPPHTPPPPHHPPLHSGERGLRGVLAPLHILPPPPPPPSHAVGRQTLLLLILRTRGHHAA